MNENDIEREVARMDDAMAWPQMHLPVKKIGGDSFQRVGVILHIASHPYDVFECNQFYMNDKVITPLREGREPECPVHHYNSFREVVEAGWVGD